MTDCGENDLSALANLDVDLLLAGIGDDLDLDKWIAELETPDLSELWAAIDLSDLLTPLVQTGPDEVLNCPD